MKFCKRTEYRSHSTLILLSNQRYGGTGLMLLLLLLLLLLVVVVVVVVVVVAVIVGSQILVMNLSLLRGPLMVSLMLSE